MTDFGQYLTEKTGLRLSEEKLSSLSKIYKVEDFTGEKLFEMANNLVNPETSFFRNMEIANLLKNLMEKDNRRIWFAGCSTGQEVYSTFLLSKKTVDLDLVGTDISLDSINHAKKGKYVLHRSKEIEKVDMFKNEPFLNIFPSESLTSVHVEFNQSLRRIIHFDTHNLVTGPYSFGYDIVVCRNVLLHMTDKGKLQVLKSLAESVKNGGYLLLGDTDPKMNSDSWMRIKEGNLVVWKKL